MLRVRTFHEMYYDVPKNEYVTKIYHVKERLHALTGFTPETMKLIYAGEELTDDTPIDLYTHVYLNIKNQPFSYPHPPRNRNTKCKVDSF